MPNNFADLGVADYNQQFLDALEFVDDVIQARQHMKMSVWRSMIKRGAYTLGEGLVKKHYRFHAGLGDQHGLAKWDPIQISRVSGAGDAGFDACAYDPHLVEYGFETVNYTGLMTSRRTQHICIRDIRFTWQFRQQLDHIMGFLGDITNSVWENYQREQYIKHCTDAGNFYVLSTGSPNNYTVTYDPFSEDDDGDSIIEIDAGIPISTLDWSYMRWYSRWLQMQCGQAAIGNVNGKPIFGLVCDLENVDRMIEKDPELREDFRFASPEVNIQNYGLVTSFKGYSMMHDLMEPRFQVKSTTANTLTLKRVDPLLADEAVTIGNKVNVNPEYMNAEFAVGIIFMNDVYMTEVPPAGPSNPGGGTRFGATPSLNGEFQWLNIQNEKNNLLNENGFYFSRYEGFAKPMLYHDEPICFLYRRCPHSEPASCEVGGDAAVPSPVNGTGSAVAVDGSDTLFTLSLVNIMDEEPPEEVSIQVDGGSSYTVVVADSTDAPNYVFAARTAADATAIIAGSTFIVSW